jgi:hypothetical protein
MKRVHTPTKLCTGVKSVFGQEIAVLGTFAFALTDYATEYTIHSATAQLRVLVTCYTPRFEQF